MSVSGAESGERASHWEILIAGISLQASHCEHQGDLMEAMSFPAKSVWISKSSWNECTTVSAKKRHKHLTESNEPKWTCHRLIPLELFPLEFFRAGSLWTHHSVQTVQRTEISLKEFSNFFCQTENRTSVTEEIQKELERTGKRVKRVYVFAESDNGYYLLYFLYFALFSLSASVRQIQTANQTESGNRRK